MLVNLTFDLDDDVRQSLAWRAGKCNVASAVECTRQINTDVRAFLDGAYDDYTASRSDRSKG